MTKAKIAKKTLRRLKGNRGPAGAEGPPGATGATGPAGSPATADGPDVVMGRVVNPGSVSCLIGSPAGVMTSSTACTESDLVQASEVVPKAKVIRNFVASLPATSVSQLTVILETATPFFTLGHCDIPAGSLSCTIAGPLSVSAGTQFAVEIDRANFPSSVGYGMELWSPTAIPSALSAPSQVTGRGSNLEGSNSGNSTHGWASLPE